MSLSSDSETTSLNGRDAVGPIPRRVSILGSTGSIGCSALDVISRLPGRFTVVGLSARSNLDALVEQVRRFRPQIVGLADESRVEELRTRLRGWWAGELCTGPRAAEELAGNPENDLVLNGVVGAAGLGPSWRAIREGTPLALANKESLVIAGAFLTREAVRFRTPILPVDSEHNGLFQLLEQPNGRGVADVSRIVLTASGGPFRTRELSSFDGITPAEALRHPTWSMGARITIDSATLLNKGFEVLEAKWLFDLPASSIEVWVHPQSIVHGLVEWRDGSTTAQLSSPDMRIPIQYALSYPERLDAPVPSCDLTKVGRLDFEMPDPRRYPCLSLARRALEEASTAPAVLNAADEVVVQAFLDGEISFPQISEALERVLDARPDSKSDDLDAVMEADQWARRQAAAVLARCH